MQRWWLITVGVVGGLLVTGLSLGAFGLWQSDSLVSVSVLLDGAPADALLRVFEGEAFLRYEYTDVHTPGRAQFTLPRGNYRIAVEHGAGFTTLPHTLEFQADGGPVELTADLERIIEPSDFGYFSADLHTHTIASAKPTFEIFGIPNHGATPVDQAVGVQLAADLDVMFISDHNTASGHEVFAATAAERGVPYVLSEEITTVTWGHYNAYSLRPGELVAFEFAKTPTEFFDEARENGASIIQINHPYSIAFGYFFSEDSPRFDSRFDLVEAFNDDFDLGDQRTIERLFEFWNAGKRYVASAVSDDHDWMRPGTEYGTPRTYVHLNSELTAEVFLERLKAGRAFVSYGPMLMLTNDNGAIPGDNVPPGDIIVHIESVAPLDGAELQIVVNGAVVQSVPLDGSKTSHRFTVEAEGWVVAQLRSSPRNLLALTNPLWIVP